MAYAIRVVPLSEVKSIRQHTPPPGWKFVIVVLTSGLAFPPLYFYNGGVRDFLSTLKEHVFLVRSVNDANVFLINDIQDPLQRSLTYLELPGALPVSNIRSSLHIEGPTPSIQNKLDTSNQNNQDKIYGGLKHGGVKNELLRDPAREILIHGLEKFSMVTKFAHETTAHIFGENRLLSSIYSPRENYLHTDNGEHGSGQAIKPEKEIDNSVES